MGLGIVAALLPATAAEVAVLAEAEAEAEAEGGLAIKPRYIRSFLTRNLVGILGTGEVTGVGTELVLGMETLGILKIVEPSELSCFLLVDAVS